MSIQGSEFDAPFTTARASVTAVMPPPAPGFISAETGWTEQMELFEVLFATRGEGGIVDILTAVDVRALCWLSWWIVLSGHRDLNRHLAGLAGHRDASVRGAALGCLQFLDSGDLEPHVPLLRNLLESETRPFLARCLETLLARVARANQVAS